MKKQILLYGLCLAALTGLLKWLEYRFLITTHAFEIYAGLIALFFTVLGIWAGSKLIKPKQVKEVVFVEKLVTVNVPQPVFSEPDLQEIEKRGISNRELEVLQLIANGLSNQEIADKLFVSLNTVKTHTSNLFIKLDVSRRTQAIQKAKSLRIIS
ncbi:MAG: response regulator transcription factor [Bacteroidota bacterium]|nr:response regulator transcription factor [Bacteroidota bacterium]